MAEAVIYDTYKCAAYSDAEVRHITEIVHSFHHTPDATLSGFSHADVFRSNAQFHRSLFFHFRIRQVCIPVSHVNDAILSSALKEIDLSEKVRNELVDRMIIDFDRGAGLLDNPVIDKEDSVTHGHGFRLIMSYIDNSNS